MLHGHQFPYTHVAKIRMAAASHMYIELKGKVAHAGMNPWKGRSALDGVGLVLHGVNLMREHVEPTARIHYTIEDGGKAANVVPDHASVMLTYRDADRGRVAKGVALHTWSATASHGHSIGHKGAVRAARVLALSGVDILTDAKLREAARADLEERTKGYKYESPLPDVIKEPVGLPDALRKHGTLGELKEAFTKRTEDHTMGLDPHDHDHGHGD